MRRSYQLLAACAAAVLTLSSCGGGGSSSPQPHVATAQTAATPPASAANRTSVGTAKLTLALPKVVTAQHVTGAVRAVPHGAARALLSSVARSPKYINPSPNPSQPPCNGNILDIYVDGTLLPALDNGPEAPDSLCVVQTSDGTQAVSLPLYSTSSNQIVAIEWDSTDSNILALGEADNGSFQAGTTITLSLTMQMNAEFIGITDLFFDDVELMTGFPYDGLSAPCPGTSQFAVFTADATGTFVPVAGYGGTSTPTVTGVADSGNTKLVQSSSPGIYTIAWDSSCDSISATASATNPAFALYSDASTAGGVYPGIDSLYSNNTNGLRSSLQNQVSNPTATGEADIQDDDG